MDPTVTGDAVLAAPLPQAEVHADAELVDARVLANRQFRDHLELEELRRSVRFIAAKGVVVVGHEAYTVSTGQHHTQDPLKQWRNANPQVSGRQFRKLRKRLRRLAKSRAVRSLLEQVKEPDAAAPAP